jgi:hypothetical protein
MADEVRQAPGSAVSATGAVAWRPLLSGMMRERALEHVRDIADHLRAGLQFAKAEDASLGAGRAGIAVFFAYLHQCFREPGTHALAAQLLEEAMDAVAATPMGISLYAGFPGVAWTTAHLCPMLFELDTDDPNESVDATLREHLNQPQWWGDYDLIRGLVGLGVYALERLPSAAAADCLERVVWHLATKAQLRPDGAAWWTDPHWLPEEEAAKHPHGYYNLGVAHGVPGAIALLGAACQAGIGIKKARPLLVHAVPWVLAQQHTVDGAMIFPLWVEDNTSPGKSRLAWCYGDAGVAAALFRAGRDAGEPAWERAALDIASRAVKRPPDQTGVVDAGLCHGAAGLGHLFNRLGQESGNELLGDAARFWFEQTLAMRRPGQGVGGYQAWGPAPSGDLAWWDDPSFLTGAAGIGLALLAAASDVEPRWDRVLLSGPFSAVDAGRRRS